MIRSNLEHWKQIQDSGYFESHPCYNGLTDFGADEGANSIAQFRPLRSTDNVVVIGCGYGRETVGIAKKAMHVWGIDVGEIILSKARTYLAERGVANFTAVLAESYVREIPSQIDVVFSIVVMQHLTRDLVADYFVQLTTKMKPGGCFVVQFIESVAGGGSDDVDLSIAHEPSINWTVRDLYGLSTQAGLEFSEVRSIRASPDALWHWAYLVKPS